MGVFLLQGAELQETDYFEKMLENKKTIEIGKFVFLKGYFGDNEVIISRTKVGEINAAIATTIAIMKFNPDIIINQGTSGGHGREVHKGDLIIGEKYVQLNSFYTKFSEEGSGSNIENWKIKDFHTDDEFDECIYYADRGLVEKAELILPSITDKKIHKGIIGSGDVWNREIDRILYYNEEFGTLCEEMETAGVYKTANQLGKKVISIRIVSNNEILKEEYDPSIAEECQKIIYEFIKRIEI